MGAFLRISGMRHLLLLALLLPLAACTSGKQIEALQGQLAAEKAKVQAYENRFGKLPSPRERLDIQLVQANLTGKTGPDIFTMLGQPDTVFTLRDHEAWTYRNAVIDAATGRDVDYLEFWLKDGRVKEINFSY
jgi:hypothetical protein